MATGSKKIVTQPGSLPESVQSDIDEALKSGLADFSIRELLGFLISSAGTAERKLYLQKAHDDRPNGFYDRQLQVGATPIDIRVPRTRGGQFRPASLPAAYQRGYSEETRSLLMSMLASSRSINAAKQALRQMGLSSSEQDLDEVAASFVEELQLRNSRTPLIRICWRCLSMESTSNGVRATNSGPQQSMSPWDYTATVKNAFWPACRSRAVKVWKGGRSCCMDFVNAVFAV
jgi:transposase-like protein